MSVTIEDFERYRMLHKKARELEQTIKALKKKNAQIVKDKVTGSMKRHPFIKQNIPIYGLTNNSRAIRAKEKELSVIRAELLTLGARIDGYLKTVKDSEIKDILILYYIDGITYRQLTQYLGRQGDGTTEMKRVRAYFKKQK